MKKFILITFLLFVTSVVSSQTITLKLDTIQFFSHSIDFNTDLSRELNQLNYENLGKCSDDEFLVINLDEKTIKFNKLQAKITKITSSQNLIDIEFIDNGIKVLLIYGKTVDGGMILLVEHIDGDLVKGWFEINPQVVK